MNLEWRNFITYSDHKLLTLHIIGSKLSQVVVLDVLLEEGQGLGLLTVVLDGAGRSSLHLSGDTGLVVLALAEPLTELLSGVNLDEGDLVLLGKSSDDLLVLGVVAVGGENAQVGLLGIQRLSNLVQSLNNT